MHTPQALPDKVKITEAISAMFDRQVVERIASETKFAQRQRVLGALDFLYLCISGCTKQGTASLEELCGDLAAQGKYIAKQSLDGRFSSRAVSFVKELVGHALRQRFNATGLKSVFGRVVIRDSTTVSLPAKYRDSYRGSGGVCSGSSLKIQYSYDLLSHNPLSLLVRDGCSSDVRSEPAGVMEGDLCIEDLGYFCVGRFEGIARQKAFFLSRLRFDTNVYTKRDGGYVLLDLVETQRGMVPGGQRVFTAYLGAGKMEVRLLVEKVPGHVAGEKRRKLKKANQRKWKASSERRLALCAINAYVTNTTEDQIPASEIRNHYGLRWQVEIIFKAWKSVFNIDKVRGAKIERFECMHYAALLLVLLTTRLMSFTSGRLSAIGKELSEFKFFKAMKISLARLCNALSDLDRLPLFIEWLSDLASKIAVKQPKRNKMSPHAILKIA